MSDQPICLPLEPEDKLLPCPFCGGTNLELNNTWTSSYWVECVQCGCEVHGNGVEVNGTTGNRSVRAHVASKRKAIRKWNRRPSATEGTEE